MNLDTAITLAIAVLGAVLGIINTLYQITKDRLKLKVVPKIVIFSNPDKELLCIEVINLSTYAVTISEIGFVNTSIKKQMRVSIPLPKLIDNKTWPRRLEPREAVTACTDQNISNGKGLSLINKVYAKTECGKVFYGKNSTLKASVTRIIYKS